MAGNAPFDAGQPLAGKLVHALLDPVVDLALAEDKALGCAVRGDLAARGEPDQLALVQVHVCGNLLLGHLLVRHTVIVTRPRTGGNNTA